MAQTTKAHTTLQIGDPDAPFQIPVALKKIPTKTDVSLDYATKDGNARAGVFVDAVTGEEVDAADCKVGVFENKPKNRAEWSGFREISKQDLETIEAATALDTLAVERFIPLKDVPFERVTDAYFLAPAEGMSVKPLVLLARALKRARRAGVFKLVKSKRQYLAVVYEKNGGLIVNTLAFANDFSQVVEAGEALTRQQVTVHPREVALVIELVETLTEPAEVLNHYEDDLLPLRADLVQRALAGKPLPQAKKRAPVTAPGDDLEERLRKTVESARPRHKTPAPA